MAPAEPMLHLLCGKIASGKSTLAARLAEEPGTVLVSEDHWLSTLYPDGISSLEAFAERSERLERAMGPHIITLLFAGVTVVLDFHANTRRRRQWMRSILKESNAAHVLHVMDVPDDVCKARLRARNATGNHAYAPSDEDYDMFAQYFQAPTPDEDFNLVVHGADEV